MAHFKRRVRSGLHRRCPCCHGTKHIGVPRVKRLPVSAARVVQETRDDDLALDELESYEDCGSDCEMCCGEECEIAKRFGTKSKPLTFKLGEAA